MNSLEGIHPLIINRLRNEYHFTDEEMVEVLSHFEKRNIKRKEFILGAGEVCRVGAI